MTMARVLLLSGPSRAGKTTLAELLARRTGGAVIKTSALFRELWPQLGESRVLLYQAGERLDEERPDWLTQEVRRRLADCRLVIVDSVRSLTQATAIERAFGDEAVHVTLLTGADVLRRRAGGEAGDPVDLSPVYHAANYALATDDLDPASCAAKALGYLRRAGPDRPRVDVLVGGQYGSEGKGHVASYFGPEYDVLVRVGGPNAGHQVKVGGRVYTHHQLPSGTLTNPGAALVLGAGCVLEPIKLLQEIHECKAHMRLLIDRYAMTISPADIEDERRTVAVTIGSTAQGVGVAAARRVLNRGAASVRLAGDVEELAPWIGDAAEFLHDRVTDGARVLVEGTQGTGLSLYHGPYPYVTSRDTTASGCLSEAGLPPRWVNRVIVVIRTYPIRVQSPDGATSGPMREETDWREVAGLAGLDEQAVELQERTSTTKRRRRVGRFDWELFLRAVRFNGATDLALTHADYLTQRNRGARRYHELTDWTRAFVEDLESVARVPVSLISTDFDLSAILDRRTWGSRGFGTVLARGSHGEAS